MTTVQFIAAEDMSTVLFDLNDPTGAANSSYGSVGTRWALGGSFQVQTPFEATRFDRPTDGAFTVQSRRGLGTASWRQFLSASSEANLRLGIGRLVDIVTHGGVLKIVSGTTRYLRFEPSGYPAPYAGKDLELNRLLQQFQATQGLDVSLACQPYFEGDEITSTEVSAPNDPATSTKVRTYPVTISGDLPVPAKVRVKMDSGSAVERVLIANRSQGSKPASAFADYLSDTGFANASVTGRGWTVTLGTDFTDTADADASGGTTGKVSYSTFSEWAMRARLTRTTKMDSLVGTWDVWARVKAENAAEHHMQLRWVASTGDAVNTEPDVAFDTMGAGSFGFVDVKLATITIPENVTLGGMALELWTRRTEGVGSLFVDFLWFTPTDPAIVFVPNGARTKWHGNSLDVPSGITGDAAWVAGVDDGFAKVLDGTAEAAGTPPTGGFAPGVGRHMVTFKVWVKAGSNLNYRLRITNETDNTEVVSRLITGSPKKGLRTYTLVYDAVAAKNYLYGVYVPTYTSGEIRVRAIIDSFIPALASGDAVLTDPGPRYAVDRMNSTPTLSGSLGIQGEVPAVLDPGPNHIMVRAEERVLSFHFVRKNSYRGLGERRGLEANGQQNVLGRTPLVAVIYRPRYSF